MWDISHFSETCDIIYDISYKNAEGIMNYKEAYLYLFNKISDLQRELEKLQIMAEAIVIREEDDEADEKE